MTMGRSIALFILIFFTALAASFPMRVALAWFGADAFVSARAVSGPVWNSHWEDARLGALSLGDARVRLDAPAVLTGIGRFRIDSPLSRFALIQGRLMGIENATLVLDNSQLRLPIPARGTISLEDVTVLFDGERCASASGRIASDMFQVEWGGPGLVGDLVCDGDAALSILTGEVSGMSVETRLRLTADGRYALNTRITTAAAALHDMLTRVGFSDEGGRLTRFDEGIIGS